MKQNLIHYERPVTALVLDHCELFRFVRTDQHIVKPMLDDITEVMRSIGPSGLLVEMTRQLTKKLIYIFVGVPGA